MKKAIIIGASSGIGAALAKIMYDLDDDFAKRLPENHFLSMYGLLNDDMRLVNKDGNFVDEENRLISEEGFYLDVDGNRIDKNGNSLDEDGILSLEVVYTDDEGKPIKLEPDPEPVEEQEAPTETVVE